MYKIRKLIYENGEVSIHVPGGQSRINGKPIGFILCTEVVKKIHCNRVL